MTETVRLQCLQAVQAILQGVSCPLFTAMDYVVLGRLKEPDSRKRAIAGIVVGKERSEYDYPTMRHTLEVDIELRLNWDTADVDQPGVVAEKFLGHVKKALAQDYSLGGLAISFLEVGNEVQLDNWLDKTIQAVMFCELKYRHAVLDPAVPA